MERGGFYIDHADGRGPIYWDDLPAAERAAIEAARAAIDAAPRPPVPDPRGGFFVVEEEGAPARHVDDMTPEERDAALQRRPRGGPDA